ncbi:MAG TPA: hypothetical protein DCS24_02100 [Erythrobacter sp.]|nr:hypothetical protein [Erythrobacter sp.]
MDEQGVSAQSASMKPINLHLAASLAIASATALVTPAMAQDDDWLNQPQTPGDWEYVAESRETLALFGQSNEAVHLFVMRCDMDSRRIGIARRGTTERELVMRIRTETQERVLTANQVPKNRLIAAEVDAFDPLLDAMALSRGRFAIEVEGLEPLYIPAWAEVTRVIEDCR